MMILKINSLNHSFGGLKAISDFNLSVDRWTVQGIIGPNGAGKTTLFNLVTGLFAPTSGTIVYDKHNIEGKPPYKISNLGIARTYQNLRLFGDLTVADNIRAGQLAKDNQSFWQDIFNPDPTFKEKITRLLELVGLTERAGEKACNLPYGMQRRLEIARALATEPKILMLDEPAAGMNPREVMDLVDLIRKAKEEFNLTIILIEHQMRLVEELCDNVTVMSFGQVISKGTSREVQNDPIVIKAYLGEGAIG
jgi:branched-chain amino acid transport system ATP-binding protein